MKTSHKKTSEETADLKAILSFFWMKLLSISSSAILTRIKEINANKYILFTSLLFSLHSVNDQQQYYSSHRRNEQAPQIKARNTVPSDQVHNDAADESADNTYQNVHSGTHFFIVTRYKACNPASKRTNYNPSDNAHIAPPNYLTVLVLHYCLQIMTGQPEECISCLVCENAALIIRAAFSGFII
jgi:hypothetical protein